LYKKPFDLSFKILFVNDQTFLVELFVQKQIDEEKEAQLYEESLEDCSCDGKMLPMYDEHPNWIKFCSLCGCRSEKTDRSPLPY